jgi:hypothetical protein
MHVQGLLNLRSIVTLAVLLLPEQYHIGTSNIISAVTYNQSIVPV